MNSDLNKLVTEYNALPPDAQAEFVDALTEEQRLSLIDALEYVGAPLKPDDRARVQVLMQETDSGKSVAGIQAILDRYCVADADRNPGSGGSEVGSEGESGESTSQGDAR